MPQNPPRFDLEVSPASFYKVVDIMKEAEHKYDDLEGQREVVGAVLDSLTSSNAFLAKALFAIYRESEATTKSRKRNVLEDDEDIASRYMPNSVSTENFLRVLWECNSHLQDMIASYYEILDCLRPATLILTTGRKQGAASNFEQLQHMMYEIDLNRGALSTFHSAMVKLAMFGNKIVNTSIQIEHVMDAFYNKLLKRHSTDGIDIFRDPITTDLAISIFENVDAHGEISDGKKPDEISAYSKKKAESIAQAMKEGMISGVVADPSKFNKDVVNVFDKLMESWLHVVGHYKPELDAIQALIRGKAKFTPIEKVRTELAYNLRMIEGVDPRNITYREKSALLTAEERFNNSFRNETLKKITDLLGDGISTSEELITYILNRKAELHKYFQDENSFYVCRIGAGNAFSGSAPGGLEVIPGIRPNANLEEVLGSGFDEIKEHFKNVEASAIWNDLFLATSPSKSTDKSNVLLVGPQGCGKSEILRAVGADKKSISIAAQGSDFLTCWMGEAQKNPKRLFEAALRLQKESRKHVHLLIDEIDAVLNSDKSMSTQATNLTLEFQILMDGVVDYPNLSVWGATNNPERIPMPMIRRFSKVVIVGELTREQRVELLKRFANFLPCDTINQEAWDDVAVRLEGATGDVLRKVVDHIWREKMTGFVSSQPEEAKKLVASLNEGEKFQIKDFNENRRREFKNRLGTFFKVKSEDLVKSANIHVSNFAVRSEIETAVETYSQAHRVLDAISLQ